MNARMIMMAALMVSSVACERGFNQKPPTLPAKKDEPQAQKLAVDAQCPKGIEGLYEVHKISKSDKPEVDEISTIGTSDNLSTSSEYFEIGRTADGVMQMTMSTLAKPIVMNGKSSDIESLKGGIQTGEGATYTGKCVDGVIYVTELKTVAGEMNEPTQVEQTYAYHMNADDTSGSQTITKGGRVQTVNVINKKISSGPANTTAY